MLGNSADSVASSPLIPDEEFVAALRHLQSGSTPSWQNVLLELNRRTVTTEIRIHKAIVRATWCLVGAATVLAGLGALQTLALLLGR